MVRTKSKDGLADEACTLPNSKEIDQTSLCPIKAPAPPISLTLGSSKESLDISFQMLIGDKIFGEAKVISLTYINSNWQVVLEHGLINKFQMLKYVRPRNRKDLLGDIATSSFPTFTISFNYQKDLSIESLAKKEGSRCIRYELSDCCLTNIGLHLIPGENLAFSSASITSPSLTIKANDITRKKEETAVPSLTRTDFY
jgi:hypothetical protein